MEPDDLWHPVFYVSRRCTKSERDYDIRNIEALSVVFICSKLYKYIYGKMFTICVDSAALSILNGRPSNNARVRRWQLYMQSFQFHLKVLKGSYNEIADFLTRVGT